MPNRLRYQSPEQQAMAQALRTSAAPVASNPLMRGLSSFMQAPLMVNPLRAQGGVEVTPAGVLGLGAGAVPGVGEAMDAADFQQAYQDRNMLGMGLSGASMALPGVVGLGALGGMMARKVEPTGLAAALRGEAGALGSRGKPPSKKQALPPGADPNLDMSDAAIAERAAAQGYERMVHGTAGNPDPWSELRMTGAATASPIAEQGFSVIYPQSTNIAEWYAKNAARSGGGNPHVREFMVKTEGIPSGYIDFNEYRNPVGGHTVNKYEVAGALMDAKEAGAKFVLMKGYPHPDGSVADFVMVLDPGIVRNVKARFEPKFAGRPGLNLGIGATAIAPGVYVLSDDDLARDDKRFE